MKQELVKHYKTFIEFLGQALGPDYEIILYDLENENNRVVAICNGNISNLKIGDKLSEELLSLLQQEDYISHDIHLNGPGPLKNISILRTSTMLIKDTDGSLIGLICVNFDDSRFLALHDHLLSIAHPLDFLQEHSFHTIHNMEVYNLANQAKEVPEKAVADTSNIDNLMKSTYRAAIMELKLPTDRLTQEERVAMVSKLQEYGFFKMKGSVPFAAEHLQCSTASVYRYLNDIKNNNI